jgi:hypothetical protein
MATLPPNQEQRPEHTRTEEGTLLELYRRQLGLPSRKLFP